MRSTRNGSSVGTPINTAKKSGLIAGGLFAWDAPYETGGREEPFAKYILSAPSYTNLVVRPLRATWGRRYDDAKVACTFNLPGRRPCPSINSVPLPPKPHAPKKVAATTRADGCSMPSRA